MKVATQIPGACANRDGRPRHWYRHLDARVVAAIVLAAVVGHVWPATDEALTPPGGGFTTLVMTVITPVIVLTLVDGIAGLRERRTVGRVAAGAFGYVAFFFTRALIFGRVVGNVAQPGAGMNVDPATLDAGAVTEHANGAHEPTTTGFLMAVKLDLPLPNAIFNERGPVATAAGSAPINTIQGE
ncbi:Na+/H+-dicarboxylate symporter [Sphingomonas insulae]|uniref:Uncharacterized protein n=1 Tax=Sphingomonas insulae TaxID=424800 RepID=A0ABN1HQ15_9SPHN|nr:cation:dicarboxylase symporter family transporter [Sphingomonas insulae]NIJ31370.1 Na+/H+-dicarboxylate symporter [Sphingomonas insulae]